MEKYELTSLEREVFGEIARLNGTEPEIIYENCYRNERMYRFRYFADRHRPPLTDIHPLARLKGLTRVEISRCDIKDLSPLADIPTLDSITVNDGSELLLCDFTPLKHLRTLYLNDYGRCTIPKLTNLPLENVSFSRLNSLEGLEGLEKLKYLNINGNSELSDLSPLAFCKNLEEIVAVDTAVTDLSPLKNLPQLREITLSNTKVTDISPLAEIPTLEMIWLYGTPVADVSCLAQLPMLSDLNLLKTEVTDLTAFKGREKIILIERKKLGIETNKKTSAEIKQKAVQLKEKAGKLELPLRPCLKRTQIKAFEERYGVKLPKEYAAYLTQIGDGFDGKHTLSTLEEAVFDPQHITKRFNFREAWIWEDDEKASKTRICSANQNGQLQLADMGDGRSFRLIVCGSAKGEVWEITDIGIAPYKKGGDFLDWFEDFLDGKID